MNILRQYRYRCVWCRSDIAGINATAKVHIELEAGSVRNRHGAVTHLRDTARVSAPGLIHIAAQHIIVTGVVKLRGKLNVPAVPWVFLETTLLSGGHRMRAVGSGQAYGRTPE